MRILSVEDDPDFQHLVSHALRNQGYEVHYAFTGKEGCEKAFSLNPDVILLDLMLPMMNGVEVMRELKKNKATRAIPIVIMTAFPGEANFLESEVQTLGRVEYLRKPISMAELVKTIQRLLGTGAATPPSAVWERGAMRLAADSKAVWIGERMIANLPPKRFEVLYHLMQNPGEAPWEDLVAKIWGKAGTKNDLEKTIQRLREDLGPESYLLATTRNGYQLMACPPPGKALP
ncbi:MAG: response regulator transcription factor [Elusimicrobia bacterium]|nr:response regulator transcription factor [Elusimicrobiota bacterium]